jgi:hypothetical protein
VALLTPPQYGGSRARCRGRRSFRGENFRELMVKVIGIGPEDTAVGELPEASTCVNHTTRFSGENGQYCGNVAALWHRHIAHPLARDWLRVVHSQRNSQSLQSSRTVWFTAQQQIEVFSPGGLHWDTPDQKKFAQDVRMVLASAEFSENSLTTPQFAVCSIIRDR